MQRFNVSPLSKPKRNVLRSLDGQTWAPDVPKERFATYNPKAEKGSVGIVTGVYDYRKDAVNARKDNEQIAKIRTNLKPKDRINNLTDLVPVESTPVLEKPTVQTFFR
jgi:hypothetical protein